MLNVSFQVKIYTSVEADEAGCKLLESLISKVAEVDAGSVKQLIIDFCKIIAHNDVSFIKKTIDEKSSHLVEGGVAFFVFFLKDLRLELKMSMWCQQLKQECNPLASFDQDVYENDQAEAKQRLMESAFLKCFSFLC